MRAPRASLCLFSTHYYINIPIFADEEPRLIEMGALPRGRNGIQTRVYPTTRTSLELVSQTLGLSDFDFFGKLALQN